jgi:hypothetical protein
MKTDARAYSSVQRGQKHVREKAAEMLCRLGFKSRYQRGSISMPGDMRALFASVSIVLLLFLPIEAVSAPIVRGEGAVISCEQWATARTKNHAHRFVLEAWVRGYVSAFNVFYLEHGDIAVGLRNRALDRWIDRYCQDHAQDTLQTAATRLIETLSSKSAAARERWTEPVVPGPPPVLLDPLPEPRTPLSCFSMNWGEGMMTTDCD